jgi:benzodiazapine receptor
MHRSALRSILGLGVSLALVAAVSAFGARYAPSSWYRVLVKPPWTPPDWIFAPVWTLLYILMAVAAWQIWRGGRAVRVKIALSFYFVQLILNGLWSWIFFQRQQIGLALADIVVLWAAVLLTCVLFWSVRRTAGVLLLPYLAWVSFAGVLNYAIWSLNL